VGSTTGTKIFRIDPRMGFGDVWGPDYAGGTIWRLRLPR
jgi:hypothetical protein